MKINKYLKLFAASSLLLTGCNMELFPEGQIGMENALETVADAEKFSNRTYSLMRSLTSGAFISIGEIQSDMFHATISYGNAGGPMYSWTFNTSEDNVEGVWSSSYVCINHANYMIEKINKIDMSELTADEVKNLNQYKGEAHFLRAYSYSLLLEKYCAAYDEATANAPHSGVPFVDVYAPTAEQDKYPGRETLADSYAKVFRELDSAAKYITRPAQADAEYLTVDAVKGLRARTYLYMDKYAEAAAAAAELINGGKYVLLDDATKFKNMWINDNGKESIAQFFCSRDNNELASSPSYGYLTYMDGTYSSIYVPTKNVIDLYDKTNDIRFAAYFLNPTLDLQGVKISGVYCCNKYPGNPLLYSGNPNNINFPKFLRIAEMYLIAAEGYAMSGDITNANKYLNDLKEKRIKGWKRVEYKDQAELMSALKDERVRELFAEGFRLNDLKRWNEGMQRGDYQLAEAVYLPGNAITTSLSVDNTNPRFVWPIPKAETDANPKLRAQQNPGY